MGRHEIDQECVRAEVAQTCARLVCDRAFAAMINAERARAAGRLRQEAAAKRGARGRAGVEQEVFGAIGRLRE